MFIQLLVLCTHVMRRVLGHATSGQVGTYSYSDSPDP